MTYGNAAFAALADPTRRKVLERLMTGPQPVAAIAAGLPISRPAVSQHLKVLKDAGLVNDTADGARRIYAIDSRGLGVMRAWLDQFWDAALDAFKTELETPQPTGPQSTRTPRRSRA
jgi:DNA-binding transcriptional ArsR family regulator